MAQRPDPGRQQRSRSSLHAFRQTAGELAASIAETEETLAATFERIAENLPPHAERLQAKAAEARRVAAVERDRAGKYGSQ